MEKQLIQLFHWRNYIMSEKEYVIEMLCCIPKRTLTLRANHPASNFLPKWLKTTENDYIQEALRVYYEEKYVKMREEILKNL